MPAGTDLVVVAGPQVSFVEPELQTLTRFLVGGGRVLLLLDPVLGAGGLERTGFGPWLEGYGVKLGEDIVVDPTNPLPFYSAETFFANEYGAPRDHRGARGRQLPGDLLAGAQRRHACRWTATPASR